MVPALPCPCRELLRWRSHALPAQSCSFLMLALDLIRVLRLPLARPHALRAAAHKDWPGARSSQDSCPLRKTICLTLVTIPEEQSKMRATPIVECWPDVAD